MRDLNLGSGGARIDALLAAAPKAERARPDLITILPLTDYVQTDPDAFRRGYAELLDDLGSAGATIFFGDNRIDRRLLCGVGRGPGGCYDRGDLDLLATKNAIVAELAASRAFVIVVPILDQNVAHPEWIAPDRAHPNDLGHAYLADRFWISIARWLGE